MVTLDDGDFDRGISKRCSAIFPSLLKQNYTIDIIYGKQNHW